MAENQCEKQKKLEFSIVCFNVLKWVTVQGKNIILSFKSSPYLNI